MTPYSVDWLPDAQQELADIWLLAADRLAVTRAQAEIDRLLASNPLGSGAHLSEGLYKVFVAPLLAFYEVQHGERLVEVSNVKSLP
jgi:plasmid stabilization system protein ParE